MGRAARASLPDSRGSVSRWAKAGAAWGVLSLLLDFGGLFRYEGPVYWLGGLRLLGIVGLAFPSRWVRELHFLSDPVEGLLNVWPSWAYFSFIVAWSVGLATLAALGIRVIVNALRRAERTRRPC